MSDVNIPDDARDVKGFYDGPILRLVWAMRAEGYTDDGAIGRAVFRVYPWAYPDEVVGALLTPAGSPLPSGWVRGMFAGRAAESAVKAARRKRD
jgi:hypothetical protein